MNTEAGEKILRKQLVAGLRGGQAHMTLDEAVKGFPMDRINEQAPNSDYTPWRLLEHIRITQKDILEFCRDPKYSDKYKDMKWPDDYWPKPGKKATKADWQKSITAINKNLEEFIKIIENPETDLNKEIEWGTGQTILREALVVIDHNSYHIGEFGILRSVMKTWK